MSDTGRPRLVGLPGQCRATAPDYDSCTYLATFDAAYADDATSTMLVAGLRNLDSLEPDPEHSAAMTAPQCRTAHVARILTDLVGTEAEARSGRVMAAAERPESPPDTWVP